MAYRLFLILSFVREIAGGLFDANESSLFPCDVLSAELNVSRASPSLDVVDLNIASPCFLRALEMVPYQSEILCRSMGQSTAAAIVCYVES